MDNYLILRKYLIETEDELFKIINDTFKMQKSIDMEYIVNIEKNLFFNIEYIENIYNDYKKLYKFRYNYKEYRIGNSIKYMFKIIFD